MKKLVLILITVAGMFLAGCAANPVEKSISESVNREVLFSLKDIAGDGSGPGYYQNPTDYEAYPTDTFDIDEFIVEDAGSYIYFKVRFNEEVHRSTNFFGRWDQILIDIYIDRDQQSYSGEDDALPGRDIRFREENAWETVVMMSPLNSEWLKDFLDTEYEDTRTSLLYKNKRLVIPDFYVVGYDTITAKVPKYIIGEPREWWGYQVAVMGFDPDLVNKDSLFVSSIRATPNKVNFGGGSAYYGNPNV
ncbi:MAG: glucodextranase DOMON-like domain-containing protein, partial [Candidatus Muiribacteriaceae bacterium]